MFEDSTFESMGKIRTRSGGWMMATLALDGSILLGLILIPLFYPEALPRMAESILMEAPPPVEEPKPQTVPTRASSAQPHFQFTSVTVPSIIPKIASYPDEPEVAATIDMSNWSSAGSKGAGSPDHPFNGARPVTVVQPILKTPTPVSSGIMSGLIVYKVTPSYPPIAKAAGTQGTVVLEATISKNGMIENLRVTSGAALLRQAAMDAVKQWRYQPYRLNGEPIEVETTVNVVFKLNG